MSSTHSNQHTPAANTWQQVLRQNFTQWETLADFLELDNDKRSQIIVDRRFPLNLPKRLAQKIAKNTLDDPILRQFMPLVQEQVITPQFVADPVCDGSFTKTTKLLHKYEGRVLLLCSSACAMHCRYCFRRNFDYDRTDKLFDEELALIAGDPSIHEVILSGGDPLSLSNGMLQTLLASIDAIPHVSRVRFHTRFPIGIPERLDDEFLAIIDRLRVQVWFIVHTNHAIEIDDDVSAALARVRRTGAMTLSQSVLLRGVNDTIVDLKELCERLVDCGILPYYIYQLDRVQGSAHFEVPEAEGLQLIQSLTEQLSGYAIPKYVRETAGQPSKTAVS